MAGMTKASHLKKGDRIRIPFRLPHHQPRLVIHAGDIAEVFDVYPHPEDKTAQTRILVRHPKHGSVRYMSTANDQDLEVQL